MKNRWKRLGKCCCGGVFLLAILAPDAAPLATTAQAWTQAEIDALEEDAEDLAQQRQEVRSELASRHVIDHKVKQEKMTK